MTFAEILAALALLVSACGLQIHEEPPTVVEGPPVIVEEVPVVEEPPVVVEEPPVVEEPLIDEARAIEIAADAGLEPGIGPWRAKYYLDPREGYVWSVTSILHESSGGSEGRTVLIDANTGRVIDFSGWAVLVEEEGVLLVKETQDYRSLVEKYGASGVTLKAVNLHDKKDAEFLRKINDGFLVEPGCIIVLQGGNGAGYVYQLDEEVNIVFRLTLSEFEEGSRNVDALTMERFYGSLE